MRLLALDTATASGSVALFDDAEITSEVTVAKGMVHSRRILSIIDQVLKEAGCTIKDVGLFAISTGPGSFTGLRVGISIVKGLAWSLKKPVVGVSTLMALAMNIPYSEIPVCTLLDARRKEVYAGIYRMKEGTIEEVMEAKTLTPESLCAEIKEKTLFLGDGLNVYGKLLRERVDNAIFAPYHLWHISASNVGRLALMRAGVKYSALEILPKYKKGTYLLT